MRVAWCLSTLVVFAPMACDGGTTGPEASDLGVAPAFTKGGGRPGGGGKPEPPAADTPLKVVFEDGATGILSDGLGAYAHETDFVSAAIRDIGTFYFQTFTGKRRDPVLRGVTVDLSSMVKAFSHSDLEDFQAAVGPDWPVFTSDVTLHTRDADGGMYAMAEGSTLVDGGKIAFNDYGGDWEWRLLFDSRVSGQYDRVGLCITHPGVDTWLVTAEAGACGGAVDGVTELWRVQGSVFIHVADFNTAMHLTLERN
jgi:hypothetical protein